MNNMECFVNMDWLRAVATWQPITKFHKDVAPALRQVAIWQVAENKVFAAATDRYRIVYAETSDTAQTGFVEDEPMLLPIDLVVSFVNGHKNVGGRETVGLVVEDNLIKINCGASSVWKAYPLYTYPRIDKLVREFECVTDNMNMMFNMKLLADIVRFANPNETFVSPAKRDTSWLFECGGPKGGTWRLSQGDPNTFGVLVQSPNSVKR